MTKMWNMLPNWLYIYQWFFYHPIIILSSNVFPICCAAIMMVNLFLPAVVRVSPDFRAAAVLAGCRVWSVIRNSASVSLSLNPFKGLSRSCWEPQERSSHIKSSSARPFLIFPRECWLISHQFVNAINVALHVEWDHFQDLRHTNCLVWSLLQSSLLCLNQLNCSTEEVGPEQSAGLHTLLPTNDMSMNGADIGRWKERKPCDC